jgi:hypothetical protein
MKVAYPGLVKRRHPRSVPGVSVFLDQVYLKQIYSREFPAQSLKRENWTGPHLADYGLDPPEEKNARPRVDQNT